MLNFISHSAWTHLVAIQECPETTQNPHDWHLPKGNNCTEMPQCNISVISFWRSLFSKYKQKRVQRQSRIISIVYVTGNMISRLPSWECLRFAKYLRNKQQQSRLIRSNACQQTNNTNKHELIRFGWSLCLCLSLAVSVSEDSRRRCRSVADISRLTSVVLICQC